MEENIIKFPAPRQESPEISKRQLLELAAKLRPQGSSEKVKRHLNMLAVMAENVYKDGFEIVIGDDLIINEAGNAGRIPILLTPIDSPEIIEVPFIDENFDDDYSYIDNYPDEKSLEEAYSKAKSRALAIIRKKEESSDGIKAAA